MKTKIFILNIVLACWMTMVFNGCKKEILELSDEEENRSFMAMFRQQANTGKSGDPLASQVVNTNDMYLVWNGINGAVGYRLQMKTQAGSWDNPADILWDTIVGPEVLKYTKKDLQYKRFLPWERLIIQSGMGKEIPAIMTNVQNGKWGSGEVFPMLFLCLV